MVVGVYCVIAVAMILDRSKIDLEVTISIFLVYSSNNLLGEK